MQISSFASYPTPPAAQSSSASKNNATKANLESNGLVDSVEIDSVEQQFLKIAKMSPLDRMRANILHDMGMTEEDLQSMSPKDRQAVEEKIKQLIEQQMQKNPTQTGQLMDVSV